jgi:hypothetical protein
MNMTIRVTICIIATAVMIGTAQGEANEEQRFENMTAIACAGWLTYQGIISGKTDKARVNYWKGRYDASMPKDMRMDVNLLPMVASMQTIWAIELLKTQGRELKDVCE